MLRIAESSKTIRVNCREMSETPGVTGGLQVGGLTDKALFLPEFLATLPALKGR